MTRLEFQKCRTEIISQMLENPDHLGIYPTTECFDALDALYDEISEQPEAKPAEPKASWFVDLTNDEIKATAKFLTKYQRHTIQLSKDLEDFDAGYREADMIEMVHNLISDLSWDYSKTCKCHENDKIGETWCCNTCGFPTSKPTESEQVEKLRYSLERIIIAPQPYNEREQIIWIETARQLAGEALNSLKQ